MEVKEEFVKLKREDVGLYLKSFPATTTVVYVAEKWKNKVSFVSPKSERISKKRTTEVQQIPNQKENFFSNLLDYFKDVKVSDITHEQNDVGKHVVPFWATKIIEPSNKDTKEIGRNDSLDKIIISETPFKCPKLSLTNDRRKESQCCDYNRENKLKLPPCYNGSEMFMPNGDQLFWVRFKSRLVD